MLVQPVQGEENTARSWCRAVRPDDTGSAALGWLAGLRVFRHMFPPVLSLSSSQVAG